VTLVGDADTDAGTSVRAIGCGPVRAGDGPPRGRTYRVGVSTREVGPAATAYEPDPRRWRILGVTLVVGFMSLLDVTIVNVAVPSIREGLDTSAGNVQWVVSGYALAFGLTLVTGGRLGDAYGRRRLMLVGLTGFILASAAVGLAPGIGLVIVARLAQGAAAGLLTPQSAGLIQELFRGPERGRAYGLFGLTVSVSSAIGPVLGGLIIAAFGDESGWRWIFLVNIPIGLVALVAIARLVPGPDPDRAGDPRLDPVGALLLGGAVFCLLLPIVSLEAGGRLPLALLVLVPVLALGFVRWERAVVRRGGAPLLHVTLLRQVPGYANGIAVGTLYFSGFTGVFLVLSVFLQDGLGYSPLTAGLMLTPFAVGSAVSAPVAGHLVSRLHRRITVLALVVMMTGVLAVAVLVPLGDGGDLLWLLLAPPLLLAGLGGGGVISPNFTLSLAEVPPRMGGAAGAALQTGQRIGSAIGAALLMTVYQLGVSSSDDPGRALRLALGTALLVLCLALAMAVRSLRSGDVVAAGPSG
jgi:EmrB/QacA subfamily drug resistance transporter